MRHEQAYMKMNKTLLVLVALFAVAISSYTDSLCPWCRGTGTYTVTVPNYTSEGTYHECALCGKAFSSRIGHSCRCSKCNGTGYMNHKSGVSTPRQRTNDYSDDFLFQNMDWDKAAVGCLFTGNPCGLIRGCWTDRNTAFAQFKISQPMDQSMYRWYGDLVDKLVVMKANELTRQYGRRIKSVIELYDYRGTHLKRTIR